MKKPPHFGLTILAAFAVFEVTAFAAAPAPPPEPETIAGTRMRVDWPRLISGNNIELPKLPASHTDSLRLGNGDIGVAVYAVPECLVLFVGKNDLLDYRTKPLAHTPEATALSNSAVPMPTTKPAGWIRFREATPRNPEALARLDIWNAEVSTRVAGRATPELRAFVAKSRNLIATEYQPTSGKEFDIELARHKDTTGVIDIAPEFGAEGRDVWVRYQFPPDPDTYPDGFEYVMLGRVIGGEVVKAEVVGDFPKPAGGVEGVARLSMKSAEPVTFLTAVFTTRDDKNPLQAARAAMDAAERAGLPELRREQAQAWQDFWKHSFVQLEGRDFLNQQWFLNLYHLASVTKPGSVGPGLFGPWAPEDFPPWGNDRHWDYNVQATLWGAFSCNHLELTKAYNDEIFDLLPCAQMMVRDYYVDIGGAKFPSVGWPRKYTAPVSSRNSEFTSPWINGFVAQPLWWYYQYSQDKTFLREKGYPVIKACAEFYENFVQPAPDGKYDMPPTGVWDLAGMIPDPKNSTIDLAFAKMLLRTAVAASEVLEVDQDRRASWEHVAANLRGYATAVIDGKNFKPLDRRNQAIPLYTNRDFPSGDVLVGFQDFPVIEYNISPWTMPIFPAGEFGLHSPQKERELALRTVQITPYYLWDDLVMLSMAWVRLGQDPLDVFEKHTRAILHENGCQTYPNTSPGLDRFIFMHFLGWPVVINESLVQSYTGQIRVAPVKLKNTARFARLRTEGAFLISGEIRSGGKVSYLAITSEAGVPCQLMRPWDGPVRVRRLDSMEAVSVAEKDGVLTFPTAAGATYVVDRPDAPWEAQPITDIPLTPR
jgi:alpha-L-fucosidase 2